MAAAAAMLIAVVLAVAPERWAATPDLHFAATEPCYRYIATALGSRLRPRDVISAEALGVFSQAFPGNRSFDMEGLTDTHVAHHGSIYLSTYGRLDPAYTVFVAHPDVIVVHDSWVIDAFAAASSGTYNASHTTYRLPFPLVPTCEKHMELSIRRGALPHLLPALRALRPEPVTVPLHS